MKYYTNANDANFELIERPHLKTGVSNCQCGETECYYEFNAFTNDYDIIVICNHCYIECSNKERV